MLSRILALLICLPQILLAQHTIKGVFSPASNYKVVLLYKVTPTVSDYITNVDVQKDGSFQFQLDASAAPGIYRIVYAVPQEDFNFDVIYNGKEDILLTFNTETGISFKSSVENKLLASYTSSMSAITQSISNYFREGKKDTLALKAIFRTQREAQTRYEKQAENTIAYNFIKANKPYIPKKYEDVKTYVKNLKIHYFDNIDFNNKTLQSSSFLQERMLNYVFGVSADGNDDMTNYKNNIDVFCNAVKTIPANIKRILLVDLWQEMVDLDLEPVANHISKNHLLDVAKLLKDNELIETLTRYSSLSIGNKAPDFSFVTEKDNQKVTKKLSELNSAETYILVFWSSSCSHCLDEIPQLQNFIKSKVKNKLKVIAIGLEDDDKKWKEQIKNYPDFINVLGLGKWDNKIGNDYGVDETPTYFILDKDKKIVSKPEDFDVLKAYLGK
ncbi:thiol-disulfide isomerase/thioredoxin [Mariniflexile fucanivorans]|uniref:Thiol-disulfide isomerase/thioredoxin n=1 Tax=Mariniflexile fucanivorans TaxID=264023 RepID=A0A4R1RRQ8_9FLAO|nr:TlpA disulfide reductase family protein [Mariniflexile fucanivorans]TCL69123.1 thiol-disulfide isomerase/thioredoxin [Mariniflexile fucanivorans]